MYGLPFYRFVTYFVIFKITTAQVLNYGKNSPAPGVIGNTASNVLNTLPNIGMNPAVPGQVLSPLAVANNINSRVANVENAAFNTIATNEIVPTNLAALAAAKFAGASNIATFNVNTDGFPFTITSGSPGSPGFGIQVLAEALEVGGKVNVNGEIPIYGTVSVNGNVPTDGTAAVTYSCGRPVV